MDWNNLTSGLFGAILGSIIGGVVSFMASVRGAKISIRETAKLDLERRKQQEKDLKEQILAFLKEELATNLVLSQNIRISHAKVRFNDKAFEMAKMNAKILPGGLINLLLPVYLEITRFNVLANYDQDKIPYGGGYLDDQLVKQGEVIKSKITETQAKSKGYFTK